MSHELADDTVLQPTSWCVARPQVDRHLIYNSRTDEMHLVPPTGIVAYQMCDGLRTFGQIAGAFESALPDGPGEVRAALETFFQKLIARGIVEAADGNV